MATEQEQGLDELEAVLTYLTDTYGTALGMPSSTDYTDRTSRQGSRRWDAAKTALLAPDPFDPRPAEPTLQNIRQTVLNVWIADLEDRGLRVIGGYDYEGQEIAGMSGAILVDDGIATRLWHPEKRTGTWPLIQTRAPSLEDIGPAFPPGGYGSGSLDTQERNFYDNFRTFQLEGDELPEGGVSITGYSGVNTVAFDNDLHEQKTEAHKEMAAFEAAEAFYAPTEAEAMEKAIELNAQRGPNTTYEYVAAPGDAVGSFWTAVPRERQEEQPGQLFDTIPEGEAYLDANPHLQANWEVVPNGRGQFILDRTAAAEQEGMVFNSPAEAEAYLRANPAMAESWEPTSRTDGRVILTRKAPEAPTGELYNTYEEASARLRANPAMAANFEVVQGSDGRFQFQRKEQQEELLGTVQDGGWQIDEYGTRDARGNVTVTRRSPRQQLLSPVRSLDEQISKALSEVTDFDATDDPAMMRAQTLYDFKNQITKRQVDHTIAQDRLKAAMDIAQSPGDYMTLLSMYAGVAERDDYKMPQGTRMAPLMPELQRVAQDFFLDVPGINEPARRAAPPPSPAEAVTAPDPMARGQAGGYFNYQQVERQRVEDEASRMQAEEQRRQAILDQQAADAAADEADAEKEEERMAAEASAERIAYEERVARAIEAGIGASDVGEPYYINGSAPTQEPTTLAPTQEPTTLATAYQRLPAGLMVKKGDPHYNLKKGVQVLFAGGDPSANWERENAEKAAKNSGIPSLHEGGIVPGAEGEPQMILAEGGEMVLTPEQQEELRRRQEDMRRRRGLFGPVYRPEDPLMFLKRPVTRTTTAIQEERGRRGARLPSGERLRGERYRPRSLQLIRQQSPMQRRLYQQALAQETGMPIEDLLQEERRMTAVGQPSPSRLGFRQSRMRRI